MKATTRLFVATTSKPHTELAEEMCEKLKAVIYEYADRIPFALAIGVIEIAKMEIMEDAK